MNFQQLNQQIVSVFSILLTVGCVSKKAEVNLIVETQGKLRGILSIK